jgi:uncharacterized protein (DUF4213/DUF364 family)
MVLAIFMFIPLSTANRSLKIADVVIITASTLVNNTFEDLLDFTGNARLVGLYGPGASLIPDEFFDRNIDFITSFQITDPVRFSDDMINDHDMDFPSEPRKNSTCSCVPWLRPAVLRSRESCGR